jgi:hypothetical protein
MRQRSATTAHNADDRKGTEQVMAADVEKPQPIQTPETGSAEKVFERPSAPWTEIGQLLSSLYEIASPSSTGSDPERPIRPITDAISSKYLAIDHASEIIDYNQERAQRLGERFRPRHLELLLDQAADLLERVLKARAEWDELAVKAFNLALELEEYYRVDDVHQKEIIAGVYTLPSKQSVAERHADEVAIEKYNEALRMLTTYEQLLATFGDIDKGWAAAAAVVSSWPALTTEASQRDATDPAKRIKYTLKVNEQESTMDKSSWLQAAVGTQMQHERELRVWQINHQRAEIAALLLATKERLEGVLETVNWTTHDSNFRRSRTEIARSLADLKAKAATDTGAVLNYPERMREIQLRFARDFRDVLDRVFVASDGLEELYDYSAKLPLSIQAFRYGTVVRPGQRSYIDELTNWVRDAVSHVVMFTQMEQNYVLPVSIKGRIGQGWHTQVTEADGATVDIDIDDPIFAEQRHVRLRGISAFVVGKKASGVWRVTVTPPKNSKCRTLSGIDKDVSQVGGLTCRLWRVTTRDSAQPPDIAGTTALRNVCPFTTAADKWKVHLENRSSDGTDVSNLDDLQIDLHLTIRSFPQ